MKALVKTLIASTLLMGATLAACGQELKIGFVNLDRVLRDAAPAQAAQTKLDAEVNRRKKELVDAEARLKAASDRFDKDAPTLNESERIRRQRDLVEQDRELQRKRRQYQEDLNERKNDELSNVVERANIVVKQIFDQEKFDLILQDAVYAGPRVDITDKVIKALNGGPGK